MMRRTDRQQRGAVLLTSLLMLLVLTLLTVASLRIGGVNLIIVDNMQSQQRAEAVGQRAVADVLSDYRTFASGDIALCAPESAGCTSMINGKQMLHAPEVDGTKVTVDARKCIGARPAVGYSMVWGSIAPEDTSWEFRTEVADTHDGARAVLRQGVDIRITAGNCP